MKNLSVLAVSCLFLLCCATRQERAIRHLTKAIELDSSILFKQSVDTIITGRILVRDTIKYKQKDSDFALNIDSINRELDKSKAPVPSTVIFQDSNKTVTVKRLPSGKLMARIESTEVTIPYERVVTYTQKITVPGKGFKVPVDRPFWHYKWFWALLTSNLLFLYYFLSRNKKATIFIEQIRNKVTRNK